MWSLMRSIFLAFLCVTFPLRADADKTPCQEKIIFSLDQKEWVKGFEDSKDGYTIIEFTPKGQSVDDWKELVTVQTTPPIKDIREYYDRFVAALQQNVEDQKVNAKVLSQDSNSILFEWWIDKGPEAQHEWFRLFKTPSATLILRFTTKNLNQVDTLRPIWEKNLQDAHYETEGDCSS